MLKKVQHHDSSSVGIMKLSHVENSLFKADGFMCFSTIVLSALLPILLNNVSLIIFLCYLNRSQDISGKGKMAQEKNL